MAKWGILFRAGRAMIIGPLLAGAGGLLLAGAGSVPVALLAATLMGFGTIIFTGHLGPLLLLWTPDGMVARFQDLFVLVQSAPQLVTIAGLGAVAELIGPGAATAGAGIVCAAAGVVVATNVRLRTATRPTTAEPAVSNNGTPGPDQDTSG